MTNLRFVLFGCGVFCAAQSYGQAIQTRVVTPLGVDLLESSGLTQVGSALITHNDSGNDPVLFEIDTITGGASRQIWLTNASNRDWEAITRDLSYLYIGDFGNNLGSRTDLCIYRVAISDYLTATNDSVPADTIMFHYPEQVTFPAQPFQTAFDAEALISMGDSLYIFTKNWTGSYTLLYALPKQPGNFAARLVDTIPVTGLVTDATFDSENSRIALTTNTPQQPRLILFFQSDSTRWSPVGTAINMPLVVTGSIQVEAIHYGGGNQFWITSETGNFGSGHLSTFEFSGQLGLRDDVMSQILVYPNPIRNAFFVHIPPNIPWQDLAVFDMSGRKLDLTIAQVYSDLWHIEPTGRLPRGLYYMQVNAGDTHYSVKILKE
jgi:hypothetical protein